MSLFSNLLDRMQGFVECKEIITELSSDFLFTPEYTADRSICRQWETNLSIVINCLRWYSNQPLVKIAKSSTLHQQLWS